MAKELGFEGDTVKWVRTSFDTAVAGSDSNFDFNLQQFTINADREKVVSFSDPYYTANQALLGYIGGPGEDVKSVADLKQLKLGAAAGTTSLQFITDVIQPDAEAFAFNSNADAATALDNKQIDAIISDLPTAIFWANAGAEFGGIDNTKVFGQFPLGRAGWRSVGPALREGQPAGGVRQHRTRQPRGVGRARHHHHQVDDRLHRGTDAPRELSHSPIACPA